MGCGYMYLLSCTDCASLCTSLLCATLFRALRFAVRYTLLCALFCCALWVYAIILPALLAEASCARLSAVASYALPSAVRCGHADVMRSCESVSIVLLFLLVLPIVRTAIPEASLVNAIRNLTAQTHPFPSFLLR